MSAVKYSREQVVTQAKLTPEDLAEIKQRRRSDTQRISAANHLGSP